MHLPTWFIKNYKVMRATPFEGRPLEYSFGTDFYKTIDCFSVRYPVLLRRVLLLAKCDVHRDVVAGAQPRGSRNLQEDEAKNVILLVLFMVLGSLGDTYPRLDDHGS